MKLGAFSISLTVKDLEVSREFYEKLGFAVTGGSAEHNYLIMKNGDTLIGLFHGMFDKNILTFNPGLTQQAEQTDDYTDVRAVQAQLREAGIEKATSTTCSDRFRARARLAAGASPIAAATRRISRTTTTTRIGIRTRSWSRRGRPRRPRPGCTRCGTRPST